MRVNFPYSQTITMRRSRKEIIDQANAQKKSKFVSGDSESPEQVISRICVLTGKLKKKLDLDEELKKDAFSLHFQTVRMQEKIRNSVPEWRRLDKSLSS